MPLAAAYLGMDLGVWIAIITVLIALLSLLLGEGIVIQLMTVINRGYSWEVKPVRDPADRTVRARISHDYKGSRELTQALIVVHQPPLLRLLWRLTHRQGVERWIVAADLLDGKPVLSPGKGLNLDGVLNTAIPLPTWKLWARRRTMQDPAGKRLILLLKFDRHRGLVAKRVKLAAGSLKPLSGPRAASVPPAPS